MSDPRPKLDSLFEAAVEIESAEELVGFLDKSCGEDHELRRQVEQLLQAHKQAGSFLQHKHAELEATCLTDASGVNLAASLQAGLAATFGKDAAVVVGGVNHSVLRALQGTIDVPRVALRESGAAGDDPIVRPTSTEMPERDPSSRYRLDGEIARGGMGVILKGRDTDLGRDLAIKVLLDEHATKPEVIQRFVEEAQIGGQLQHPGIAPVYELGQFADRRPFFSMKLVKGQTLLKMLTDRTEPAADRGRFVLIFEQICQTMAYAHSRGVIHRDLKPANIMVGAFGEVQVMDWGLAKVLTSGGIADEMQSKHQQRQGQGIIQTARSGLGGDAPGGNGSSGFNTQLGSVMGTPAYMPPEQALGEIDNLDERSDVFGLGAILCEILTGLPPYVGTDGASVFRLASRGELNDCLARLNACGADGELIALAKHCLELEPGYRPRDAGGVAERISGYLASVETKLRETELERAKHAARAEELHRRRRLLYAIAALLLAGIIGSGVAAVHFRSMERRQRDLALEKSQLATQNGDLAKEMTAERNAAIAARAKAEQAESETLAAYRLSTDEAIEKLIGAKPELGRQEQEYLKNALKRWQAFADRKGNDERSQAIRGEGHHRVGFLWGRLGRKDRARTEFQLAREIRQRLVELHPGIVVYQEDLALSICNLALMSQSVGESKTAQVDLEAARAIQQRLAEQFPHKPGYRYDLAETHNHLGTLLRELGQHEDARFEHEAARDLGKLLVDQFPQRVDHQYILAVSHSAVGNLFFDSSRYSEARVEFQACRDILMRLTNQIPGRFDFNTSLAMIHHNMGFILAEAGDSEAGRVEYLAAREIQKDMVKQFPNIPDLRNDLVQTHMNLARLLDSTGKLDEAAVELIAARELGVALVAQFPNVTKYRHQLAFVHHNYGTVLLDVGRGAESLVELQAARDVRRELAQRSPDVPAFQFHFGNVLNDLAIPLARLGRQEESLKAYEAARDIYKKLAEQYPAMVRYRAALAGTQTNLGGRFRELGKHAEAGQEYQEASGILKALCEQFPDVPKYQSDLANVHNEMGLMFDNIGDREQAKTEYQETCRIQKKLVEQFPAVPSFRVHLGGAYCNYAHLIRGEGDAAGSLSWYNLAIETLRSVYESDPRDFYAQRFLMNSLIGRAAAFKQLKMSADWLEDLKRVVELSPPESRPLALLQLGLIAEAVAEVNQLTAPNGESQGPPKRTFIQWYNFACVYALAGKATVGKEQEYADRAIELLRLAIKEGFRDAKKVASDSDLESLRSRDDFKAILSDLERHNSGEPNKSP